MLARPRMSVTQWVRPRQGILIRSILPLFLFTPHKMTRAGEGEGRRFALNCGPTSERKCKTKRIPFSERRGGSNMSGCNANATRAMYSQNRLTGRHRNHYHQNLRCSAYASHCPKTTPNLQPLPPPFDPLARIKRPLVRRKAMVHRKITYYKMLTPERHAEIAVGGRRQRPP